MHNDLSIGINRFDGVVAGIEIAREFAGIGALHLAAEFVKHSRSCFVANLNPAYVYAFVFKGLKGGGHMRGDSIGSLLGCIRSPFNRSILFTGISP